MLILIFDLSYAKIPFAIWCKHFEGVYITWQVPQTILPRSFMKWFTHKIFWWRINDPFLILIFLVIWEIKFFHCYNTVNQRIYNLKYKSLFFLKRLKETFPRDKVQLMLSNAIKKICQFINCHGHCKVGSVFR